MPANRTPAAHPAPRADRTRASRPSLAAGALASALLLPSALLPGPARAQEDPGASSDELPELSSEPAAPEAKATVRPKAAPKPRAAAGSVPTRWTVRRGESLRAIARRLTGPGASDTEVADALVAIWNANDIRIGTGDPDQVPIGVRLRIPAALR